MNPRAYVMAVSYTHLPGRGFTDTPSSVSQIQMVGVISAGKSCEAHPNAERRGKIHRGMSCV